MNVSREQQRMKLLAECSDTLQGLLTAAFRHVMAMRSTELRHVLLLAGINRNTQAQNAIAMLAAESFVEDAWVLLRSMLEATVNLCYL